LETLSSQEPKKKDAKESIVVAERKPQVKAQAEPVKIDSVALEQKEIAAKLDSLLMEQKAKKQ